MNKIKISFVVTGRNDDYGGNLINRASTFVRVLSHFADKYRLPIEIIFVEYNPIPEKYLFEEIYIPHVPFVKIRGIIVPREFHERVKQNNIPVLEYIAKNIGIRRAKGEYILATNPDIIFSEELIRHISEDKLNQSHFYRTDRNDIKQNKFSESLTPEEILKACKKNVIKILYTPRTHYVSWLLWLNRFIHDRRLSILSLAPFFNYRYPPNRTLIYENASGDFLLAHRSVWEKAYAYDETPHNLHHDGLMLYVLQVLGYKQEVLQYPIYHISHQEGRIGRPGIEFSKYRKLTEKMQETGIPHILNNSNWGFLKEKFEERIIHGEN